MGGAVAVHDFAVLPLVALVYLALGLGVGLPIGAVLALRGFAGLGALLLGLLGGDEAAAGFLVGDGELLAQALGVRVIGGNPLGHVFEHLGGGIT